MDPTDAVLGTTSDELHDPGTMRDDVRRGGRAGMVTATVEQVLSAVTTVVLARLLTPSDFGIVAGANIILGLVAIVGAVGAGQALVKRKTIDDVVTSTLFWTSTLVLSLGAVVVAALAPWLARAAAIPDATPYVVALAPTLVLAGVATVPRALLQRELALRRIFRIELAVAIVYTIVQIGLASFGAGAWAVIVGQLVKTLVFAILLVRASRFAPSRRFDRGIVRDEARFGAGVLAGSVLNWLGKNLDYWVVVRIGSARLLGVYYVAYVLPTILRQRLTWVATDLLLPVFARLQDDARRTEEAYVISLRLHAFVGFPAMVGLALVTGPTVHLFFGSEWLGAVAPMRLLALAAAVDFVANAAQTVLLAHGFAGAPARAHLTRVVVMAIALVPAALVERADAVALAVLIGTIASAIAMQASLQSNVGLHLGKALRAIAPIVLQTIVMAIASIAVLRAADGPIADLVITSSTGAVAYVGTGLLLFRSDTARLLREAVRFVRPS